jgi:hypothetical protein
LSHHHDFPPAVGLAVTCVTRDCLSHTVGNGYLADGVGYGAYPENLR